MRISQNIPCFNLNSQSSLDYLMPIEMYYNFVVCFIHMACKKDISREKTFFLGGGGDSEYHITWPVSREPPQNKFFWEIAFNKDDRPLSKWLKDIREKLKIPLNKVGIKRNNI